MWMMTIIGTPAVLQAGLEVDGAEVHAGERFSALRNGILSQKWMSVRDDR